MSTQPEKDQPVMVTQSEFMRRMKEMNAMGGGGGMSFMGNMPESYNLVVNTNHLVVDWLTNHIRKLDTALGAFLKTRP